MSEIFVIRFLMPEKRFINYFESLDTEKAQNGSKWLKMAINGPFVAISSPGGSKMVDQRGSRFDQGSTRPGGCVGSISRVRGAL